MKKVLDLYCGDGGCSMGYHLAGFEVTGVDKYHMKNYPFRLIQADALEILDDLDFCRSFDLIHASPECQEYSVTKSLKTATYGQDIETVRKKLQRVGSPYVIENVPGSPLKNYVLLCGSMFGIGVIRHRLFECWPEIYFPPFTCAHRSVARMGRKPNCGQFISVCGNFTDVDFGRRAMGIDWMPRKTLSKAIPPKYTEWIGQQMLFHIA